MILRKLWRLIPFRRTPAIDPMLWSKVLSSHPIFFGLPADASERLKALSERFKADKQIEPAHDVTMTEEIAVTLASLACLPILELGYEWYRGWHSIILERENYDIDYEVRDSAGVIHSGHQLVSGQVMPLGPVVLSVKDISMSGRCSGYNVVVHEMAHVLDRLDRSIDGAPPLHPGMDPAAWQHAFKDAFNDLRQAQSELPGSRSLAINPYGATAPEEFFAVATEMFFETPRRLKRGYPAVYHQLSLFFRQDPAQRLTV